MESISDLQDLILVAGHAPFKGEVTGVPDQPESDKWWILEPSFQLGEPAFYIEHIRRGVVLAANNPDALLLFSGGLTRPEAGTWSEARTYFELAKHYRFWIPDEYNKGGRREGIQSRTSTEEFARDSYENLLFGICRFLQLTGHTPRLVTVVSWAFKATRFSLHRAAIRFPTARFRFDGFNEPILLDDAWAGEKKALRDFIQFPHGTDDNLLQKRKKRTCEPQPRNHGYEQCLGLGKFIGVLESLSPAPQVEFPEGIPW